MSQNAVSIDPSSGSGAATPQPAPRSVDPGRQSEFAAHLRQAGGDTTPDRTARGVRRGASPDRTRDADDRASSDVDGSTTSAAGTPAGEPGSTGSAADSQPSMPPTSVDATAGAQLGPADTGATTAATEATAAATVTAAAKVSPTAGAVIDAVPNGPAGGIGSTAAATGATGAGPTARGAAGPGAVTPGGVERTAGPGGAGAVTTGLGTAASTTATPGGAAAQQAGTDPSAVRPAGSAAGAVTGSVDPGAVIGSTALPSNAAPLTFAPLAAPTTPVTTAVTASASATAASAPAPTTTAPPTSVAAQLAASLRTLPGRGDGVHVMTVRLHPDELGPVRVVARLTGTDVHLRVTASSVAAAAAVSEAAPRLHEALASSGLTTTGVSVDHDADLGGQAGWGSGHQGQGAAGTSAESHGGRHNSLTRETHTGAGGFGHGVHLDVNPTSSPKRHPAARSLDLHV